MPAKASEKRSNEDPFQLQYRLEKVADWLLSDWEDNKEMKNRPDALKILQYGSMFAARNSKLKDTIDEPGTGSAVKRYSGAFRVQAPDAASRRKSSGGRTVPALVHDAGSGSDDPGDDPDSDAA